VDVNSLDDETPPNFPLRQTRPQPEERMAKQ
jgi:hypothetical protein